MDRIFSDNAIGQETRENLNIIGRFVFDLLAENGVIEGDGEFDDITVTGGTINNTPIGQTGAAAGRFSSLVATISFTASNVDINGGAIDNTPIGSTIPGTGAFTTLSASGNVTLNGGTVTIGTVDLNGGAIDGTAIGANTASTGRFTTLATTTSATFGGTTQIATIDANGGTVDAVVIGGDTPAAGTFTSLTSNAVNFGGGEIDNTPIGANARSTGAFTTLDASGNVTLDGGTTSITDLDATGGAMDDVVIGGDTPAAGTFTTLTATDGDLDGIDIGQATPGAGAFTSLEADTADINGGTADNVAIGQTTPAAGAFSSLVAANADLNGGTADNVAIGGSTPSTGVFTTLSADSLGGTAVQSSATDTTSGRLMKVGAFGLGASTPPQITDFTASLRPGFYFFLEQTATGSPGSSSFFGVAEVNKASSGATVIVAKRITTGASTQREWIGVRAGDTGSLTWVEQFNRSNIIGTVSQSSGTPTGAIIESGSNSNGAYTRFADGTQICSNFSSVSDTGTWTFPAVFSANPNVFAQPHGTTDRGVTQFGISTTAISFYLWQTNGSTLASTNLQQLAYGRWF